jgi:hypothetical protein
MRVTSEFWVSAYVRRCNSEGAFAVVQRRGFAEAGAIFIVLDDLRGACTMFAGAAQSVLGEALEGGRIFTAVEGPGPCSATDARLQREITFDPDAWIVAVEDRAGRHFLDLR